MKIKTINEAHKTLLKKQYAKAVNAYVDALLCMWGLDKHYGYWVSDDVGGMYCYGDSIFIDGNNLKFIVENDVAYNTYMEWMDYCVWASEFNQSVPNLQSWTMGCPHVDEATQKKLSDMKRELANLINETKEKF